MSESPFDDPRNLREGIGTLPGGVPLPESMKGIPLYDMRTHQWVGGPCPHGDVCTGCDARGYCTRMESERG